MIPQQVGFLFLISFIIIIFIYLVQHIRSRTTKEAFEDDRDRKPTDDNNNRWNVSTADRDRKPTDDNNKRWNVSTADRDWKPTDDNNNRRNVSTTDRDRKPTTTDATTDFPINNNMDLPKTNPNEDNIGIPTMPPSYPEEPVATVKELGDLRNDVYAQLNELKLKHNAHGERLTNVENRFNSGDFKNAMLSDVNNMMENQVQELSSRITKNTRGIDEVAQNITELNTDFLQRGTDITQYRKDLEVKFDNNQNSFLNFNKTLQEMGTNLDTMQTNLENHTHDYVSASTFDSAVDRRMEDYLNSKGSLDFVSQSEFDKQMRTINQDLERHNHNYVSKNHLDELMADVKRHDHHYVTQEDLDMELTRHQKKLTQEVSASSPDTLNRRMDKLENRFDLHFALEDQDMEKTKSLLNSFMN
jgi:hypothetical protein